MYNCNEYSGEDDSYRTAQVGPGDRGRKKSKKKKWIFIWIEIVVLKKKKISRNELARPVMGTICLVGERARHSQVCQSRFAIYVCTIVHMSFLPFDP